MGSCLGKRKEFTKVPIKIKSTENGTITGKSLYEVTDIDTKLSAPEMETNIIWKEQMDVLREYGKCVDGVLLARGGLKRMVTITSEDSPNKPKINKMDFDCESSPELTEFSGNEAAEILESCSDYSKSPGSSNSAEETVVTVVFYGTERDIQNLSDEEIENSMAETIFFLAAAEKRFHKLKAYLDKIIKNEKIQEEASKLLDNNGNNVVNAALLQGNFKAFCFLVFLRSFEIPDYIIVDNIKRSFLIYLAIKNWPLANKMFDFLLKMYPEDTNMQKLLCIDESSNDNMVTFLIKTYALQSDTKYKEEILLYLENIFKNFIKISSEIMHIHSENLDVDLIICIGIFREKGKEILARILPHLNFNKNTKETYSKIMKAFYIREPQMVKMFEEVFQ